MLPMLIKSFFKRRPNSLILLADTTQLGSLVAAGNGNWNAVLEWQWVGTGMGMIRWEWEGNVTVSGASELL